jgi:hypothetical protein
MNRSLLFAALVSITIGAHAGERDIAKLVGRYTYESFQLTLPNGQTGGFEMHGATGAETEIKADRSILFQLNLADGRTITATATLVDAQLDGNVGFIVQKWANMNYEVRTEIELTTTGLSYTNRFQNKDDHARYGMVERATLKRVVHSNSSVQGALRDTAAQRP